MLRTAALPAAALALASCAYSGSVREDYLEENERILASVPVYAGATLVESRSGAYRGADGGGDPLGYGTSHVYRLPTSARRQDVARFYRARLTEWRPLTDELEDGGNLPGVLNFCRGDAFIGVNLESAGVLELTADHDAFGKDGRPASCARAGRIEP